MAVSSPAMVGVPGVATAIGGAATTDAGLCGSPILAKAYVGLVTAVARDKGPTIRMTPKHHLRDRARKFARCQTNLSTSPSIGTARVQGSISSGDGEASKALAFFEFGAEGANVQLH
jgi:hypothetical protein